MNKIPLFLLLITFTLFAEVSFAKETVYMNEEEAVKWAFPKSDKVEEFVFELTPEKMVEIEKETGGRFHASDKKIYIGKTAGAIDGYAVITNEIGKYDFITFIVVVNPAMEINKVGVMVYRESRGGEIARKRFQQQYIGKKNSDSFQINNDIINITGATMSVRAMNRGMKKIFSILEIYLNDQKTKKESL